MVCRPFEGNQSLRDAGVRQYNWTKFKTIRGKTLANKATLETKADLEPEDVKNVKEPQ